MELGSRYTSESSARIHYDRTSGYLSFGVGTQPTLTDRLSISSSTGNVGIGTTPVTKLDIGPVDSANEGAEVKFRGATNSTVDWNFDLYQSDLRIATTDKGAGTSFSEKMRLDSSGNVGIGTSSPTQKLDVNGNVNVSGGTVDIKPANGSTDTAALQIGEGRTGNGYSHIDLIGDTTYPDCGTRIIRTNTGANAATQMYHRGTGDFGFYALEAANIRFQTDSAERMVIGSAGNVGIGTASPGQKLSVAGTIESTTGGVKFPDGTTQTSAAGSVHTGSTSTETSYPIGHTVFISTGYTATSYNNNSSATIRNYYGQYYTTGGSGTALTGTWRNRGDIIVDADPKSGYGALIGVYQRTA